MAKLSGKCAIVSGATGGLGSEIVKALQLEECAVIGLHSGRTIPRSTARMIAVDVTDEHAVRSQLGALDVVPDILCHCVGGILPGKPLEEVSLAEWRGMFELNVTSAFLLFRQFLPVFKQRGSGRFIVISAMSGIHPPPKQGGYPASKAALNAMVQMLAEEVKGNGDITVNAIAPGIIATAANKEWGSAEEQQQWTPPSDIAAMVVHLCTPTSASVNGAIIHMNGKR